MARGRGAKGGKGGKGKGTKWKRPSTLPPESFGYSKYSKEYSRSSSGCSSPPPSLTTNCDDSLELSLAERSFIQVVERPGLADSDESDKSKEEDSMEEEDNDCSGGGNGSGDDGGGDSGVGNDKGGGSDMGGGQGYSSDGNGGEGGRAGGKAPPP
jgi:hypothetical protein